MEDRVKPYIQSYLNNDSLWEGSDMVICLSHGAIVDTLAWTYGDNEGGECWYCCVWGLEQSEHGAKPEVVVAGHYAY